MTALYGDPSTDTQAERDGVTTTRGYLWRERSTDSLDTRLSLWVASRDGTVNVLQLSCDKPKAD